VGDPHPLVQGGNVEDDVRVGQSRAFGYAGRSTGVDDGCDIFHGIDFHGGRFGRGRGHNGIEKKMPGFIPPGFWYFPQQSA